MQKYGVWRIPLRVVHRPAAYRTASEYLGWTLEMFGPTWSGGKRPRSSPGKDFEVPRCPEWIVETYDWYLPASACPRWRPFQRFHSREEAVAFCERWRAQERADEQRDQQSRLSGACR